MLIRSIFLFVLLAIIGFVAGCSDSGSSINPAPVVTTTTNPGNPTPVPTISFPSDPNMVRVNFITQNPPRPFGKIIVNSLTGSSLESQAEQSTTLNETGTGFLDLPRNSEFLGKLYDRTNLSEPVSSSNFSTGEGGGSSSLVFDGTNGVATATPTTLPPTPGPGEPTWTPTAILVPTNTPTPQNTPGQGTPTWTPTVPPTATPTNTPVTPGPTATSTNTPVPPTATPTTEPAPDPKVDDPNFVVNLNGNAGGICVNTSNTIGYTVVGRDITQFNPTNGNILGSTSEGISHTTSFKDVTIDESSSNFYGLDAGGHIYQFDQNRNKINTYNLGVTSTRGLIITNGYIYYSDPDNTRIGYRSISNLSNPSLFIADGQVPNCLDLCLDSNGNIHVCTSTGIKKIDPISGTILATYGPNDAIDINVTGNYARLCTATGIQVWNISTNQKVRDISQSNGQGITSYIYNGETYTLYRIDGAAPGGRVIRYID